MNKILIATWVKDDNYGSLLQAYCLKGALKDLLNEHKSRKVNNDEIFLLNYDMRMEPQKKRTVQKLQKLFNQSIRENFSSVKVMVLRKIYKKKLERRKIKFEEFRDKELNLYPSQTLAQYAQLKELDGFDLYVVGSDQVWNPKMMDDAYLLQWVPSDATKIAYAPSVCASRLTKDELKRYEALNSFKSLSVREYTGAVKQISEMLHRRMVEVVDPVVLYGQEKLRAKCKKIMSDDYAAVYLLNGAEKQHDKYKELLKRKKLRAKIIPGLKPQNLFTELVLNRNIDWGIGPDEFINLIYNSKVLITDSYHGALLALLLHKEFIVFPREKRKSEQNNRMLSLLNKVGLQEHFCETYRNMEDIKPIEWEKVDKIINNMREKSLEYLIRAITEKNSD